MFQNNIWNFFNLFNTALMKATSNYFKIEIVKILVEQEGINFNAKNKVYFNILKFQNNIWNFFKLFKTALVLASERHYNDIAKILAE